MMHIRWDFGDEVELLCPVCGDHVEQDQDAPGSIVVHPDRDEYESPIGTRGGFTKIELFCAGGHGFDLIIGNHKGSQMFGVVSAGPRWWVPTPEGDTPGGRRID